MASELDKDAVTRAYARWAPIYDLVFGAVFDRGRKASIAAGAFSRSVSAPGYRYRTMRGPTD
jgi:hypothetical protein